ncbi:Platelet glycoprotein V [Holothuria leucospilota]|uniref:Platelet glycoprotein V n=1 Tax=Holothuria leucospilota TaxID=206669 RepID=A0A9Q1CN32_HOLLE|nr:Platelet glycoprotein V [Holothuria leucospilota]
MNINRASELGDELEITKSVETLLIANSNVSFIEDGDWDFLSNLTSLKHLSFYNNNITNLSELMSVCMKNLDNLETLTISINSLSVFPVEKFTVLKRLKYLNLECNQLQTLGEGQWNLPFLNHLHLENNKISSVKAEQLKGLCNLTNLYLSDNRITYFSLKVLESVPKLQFLVLHHNRLLHLREYNVLHTSLRHINLQNNLFESLNPEALVGLKALESILLSMNQIKDPPTAKHDVNVTVGINLSFQLNKIQNLSPLFFDNFPNILSLSVSKNRISHIEDNTFRSVTKITSLDMEQNKIHTIPGNLFKHLHQLSVIRLSHNRISVLDPYIFKSLSTQTGLYLKYNPIVCNCSVVPLIKWLNRAIMSRADYPKCQSPEFLQNQTIHLAELPNICSHHKAGRDLSLVTVSDATQAIPTPLLFPNDTSYVKLKLIFVGLCITCYFMVAEPGLTIADKFAQPPKFHCNYKAWKQELELWQEIIYLDKSKQGTFSSLPNVRR